MARSENANAGHFENAEVDLAFDYSPDWLVEERGAPLNRPANAADIPKHRITVSKPSGESVSIAIFPRVGTLEEWILLSHGYALRKGLVDLDGAKHLVSGQDAYLWSTPPGGHDTPGYLLVFQGEEHVYQVGFAVADVNSDGVREILRSLSTGAGGTTDLPPRTIHSPLKHLQSATTSCTNCGDTDQYSNPYSCCPTFGNCTWKSEQMRSGSNNFTFGTDRPRDAYRWMTLARKHTSYAQGGTMPAIGAVLVAIDDYGGFGHVGTVASISSDGTVKLTEQNCDQTCTRPAYPYAPSWIVRYLAGYIYSGTSAPTPSGKTISKTGTTVIEDYNFSNVYNFSTYGPGSLMSFNANERAWGTSRSGRNSFMHFVRSTTGTSENYGRWRASIQEAGVYEVQAWIPSNSTFVTAEGVRYDIGGALSGRINQSTNRGKWVSLGSYRFSSVGTYSIYLRDTGNSTSGKFIAFDALQFIRRG